MIPVTPGGLGLVEASLTGLLVLAEVNSSQAVLATLTYRIALLLAAALRRTDRIRPIPHSTRNRRRAPRMRMPSRYSASSTSAQFFAADDPRPRSRTGDQPEPLG